MSPGGPKRQKSLHAVLAEAEGVSLNQLCASKLAIQLRGVVKCIK